MMQTVSDRIISHASSTTDCAVSNKRHRTLAETGKHLLQIWRLPVTADTCNDVSHFLKHLWHLQTPHQTQTILPRTYTPLALSAVFQQVTSIQLRRHGSAHRDNGDSQQGRGTVFPAGCPSPAAEPTSGTITLLLTVTALTDVQVTPVRTELTTNTVLGACYSLNSYICPLTDWLWGL